MGFSFRFPVSTFRYSYRRVPPGECGLASSDGDPGTNGVISKTRCGARNKDDPGDFASGTLALPCARQLNITASRAVACSFEAQPDVARNLLALRGEYACN